MFCVVYKQRVWCNYFILLQSCRNSSGSTPLHLAAATGHKDVVAYLLQQKGIGRLKAALDNDGKSPLAVCLECKMNEWGETAQLLREAYKNIVSVMAIHISSHSKGSTCISYSAQTSDNLLVSPTLLSFSTQPTPSVENLLLEGTRPKGAQEDELPDEDLSARGSLKNLDRIDGDDRRDKVVALSVLFLVTMHAT